MLAIPFVVPNASVTLLRSSCFTILCWYTNNAVNTDTPIQKRKPPFPRKPAKITSAKVIECTIMEMERAFFLPVADGNE